MESPKPFRKKPVVIEAMCWNGQNQYAIFDWSGGQVAPSVSAQQLRVHTLEGALVANLGDWIIRGVKGEFYPVESSIFALTYEPLDAPRS